MIFYWKPVYFWFPIKLIIMAYKASKSASNIENELKEIKDLIKQNNKKKQKDI